MSLYNMMCGMNPLAAVLLDAIGLTVKDVPRFRDCYVDGENIIVYTRTGGGNREAFEKQNAELCKNPHYLEDHDDDFDSTFAHFKFKIPEASKPVVNALRGLNKKGGGEKFKALLAKLEKGDMNDPEVKRAMEIGKRVFADIKKSLKDKKK